MVLNHPVLVNSSDLSQTLFLRWNRRAKDRKQTQMDSQLSYSVLLRKQFSKVAVTNQYKYNGLHELKYILLQFKTQSCARISRLNSRGLGWFISNTWEYLFLCPLPSDAGIPLVWGRIILVFAFTITSPIFLQSSFLYSSVYDRSCACHGPYRFAESYLFI